MNQNREKETKQMTLDLTGTEGKETLLGGHVTGRFSCEE